MFRGRLSQQQGSLDQTKLTHISKINENIGETLHKEIQSYTRKFQQEKRKLFRAQENHREILKDYQNQVSDLESLKTKKYQTEIANLSAKIKYLEINMQKSIAAYNEALSKNNKLKTQIDQLRKDKKNQNQAYKTLVTKVEELNSSINKMDQSILVKKSKVDKTKTEILQIREKNQTQNNCHITEVDELKNSVYLNSSAIRQTMKNAGNKQTTQSSDATPIVKLRIKNLMHINKEKIKIAEMYKKSMEKIQQSFQEIKEESGISDLQEITKTFLKQEEQNTFIYEYINKLTTDLESLREQNQSLNAKIQNQEEELSQQRKSISGATLQQKQKAKIEQFYAQKQKPIDNLNSFLSSIEADLIQTLNLPQKQGQNFLNYCNIQQYLATLEQMISEKYPDAKFDSTGSDIKSQFTKYSKLAPVINTDDFKDRNEQAMLEQSRLRDYASDFWDKKKITK